MNTAPMKAVLLTVVLSLGAAVTGSASTGTGASNRPTPKRNNPNFQIEMKDQLADIHDRIESLRNAVETNTGENYEWRHDMTRLDEKYSTLDDLLSNMKGMSAALRSKLSTELDDLKKDVAKTEKKITHGSPAQKPLTNDGNAPETDIE